MPADRAEVKRNTDTVRTGEYLWSNMAAEQLNSKNIKQALKLTFPRLGTLRTTWDIHFFNNLSINTL